MKRILLVVFVLALLVVACGPVTPTPEPTTPTTVPTVAPTVNAKATENAIIAHVFATMTAAVPVATSAPVVVVPATPTRKPTVKPTTAAVVKATATPLRPVAPTGATADPWMAQIPRGSGAILAVSYVGNRDANFTIADKTYVVPAMGKTLIVLAPGHYNFTVQLPAMANGSKTDQIDIVADRYITYSIVAPD